MVDETLARLMCRLLIHTGPLVEDDVDAEINRRLATMMDATDDTGGGDA